MSKDFKFINKEDSNKQQMDNEKRRKLREMVLRKISSGKPIKE